MRDRKRKSEAFMSSGFFTRMLAAVLARMPAFIMTKPFANLQGGIEMTKSLVFAGDTSKGELPKLVRMRNADTGTVVA